MDAEEFIEEFLKRRDKGLQPHESYRQKSMHEASIFTHTFGDPLEELEGSVFRAALLHAAATDACFAVFSFYYVGAHDDIVRHMHDDCFRPCVEYGLVGEATVVHNHHNRPCAWVFSLYPDVAVSAEIYQSVQH